MLWFSYSNRLFKKHKNLYQDTAIVVVRKKYYKNYHSMVFMSLNQFPVRLWSQPRLKLVPKWTVISSNTGLCVGIYANLSFKQYQKELKKLTRLVIVVDINCDRTYGYSWKIHQWIYIQNFSIFYPLCSSLFRQYHSVLKHCPCLTIVMLTRNEFHSKSLFFSKMQIANSYAIRSQ